MAINSVINMLQRFMFFVSPYKWLILIWRRIPHRMRRRIRHMPMGVWIVVAIIFLTGTYRFWQIYTVKDHRTMLAIIAPDGMRSSDPALAVWLDAIREQGSNAEVVNLSELIGSNIWGDPTAIDYAAVILPDLILPQSNKRLNEMLESYVTNGGHLLISYDALSRNSMRKVSDGPAELSKLAGVDYGPFNASGAGAIVYGPILGSIEAMDELQIPPGKPVPWPLSRTGQLALTAYQYGFLSYPHFVTRGEFSGRVILESSDGSLLLGEKKLGKGLTTFANFPLGDLKMRTDGILLHAVLKRVIENAGLATLVATPSAKGGLIYNIHVDANTSLIPFAEFDRRGFLKQGPLSFHFTTGPDANKHGDKAGMDLDNNVEMKKWIRQLSTSGHGIGNHGGWIHDYFGSQLADAPNSEMKSLLERNDRSLQNVVGRPILEYSAPLGNQPEWVTQGLEDRNVLAYYFTGNSGMAPTRSYRNGKLSAKKIWSFPILNLNDLATFEDAIEKNIPEDYMASWLVSVAQYSADNRTIRTIYAHPPGWTKYFNALQLLYDRTATLIQDGKFRWYSMEGVAKFLNRREQVLWDIQRTGKLHRFSANHTESLNEMTWRLPKSHYARPVIEKGTAAIEEETNGWLVIGTQEKNLIFTSNLINGNTL